MRGNFARSPVRQWTQPVKSVGKTIWSSTAGASILAPGPAATHGNRVKPKSERIRDGGLVRRRKFLCERTAAIGPARALGLDYSMAAACGRK